MTRLSSFAAVLMLCVGARGSDDMRVLVQIETADGRNQVLLYSLQTFAQTDVDMEVLFSVDRVRFAAKGTLVLTSREGMLGARGGRIDGTAKSLEVFSLNESFALEVSADFPVARVTLLALPERLASALPSDLLMWIARHAADSAGWPVSHLRYQCIPPPLHPCPCDIAGCFRLAESQAFDACGRDNYRVQASCQGSTCCVCVTFWCCCPCGGSCGTKK